MKVKWIGKILITVALTFSVTQSVLAFSDISGDPAKTEILELKEKGIISGVSNDLFAPQGTVTNAQAVTMLTRTFDFNLDHMRFIKEPKVGDVFTNIEDNKWYSSNFLYAFHNGLALSKDINPNEKVTREQFANMLYTSLTSKYELAFIELWVMIEDEKEIDSNYMNSIQKLVVSKIIELEDGKFNPKQELTRSEAAKMIHRTLSLVESVEAAE